MKIEILYFEGCPHLQETHHLVRRVAAEFGLDVEIDLVQVLDADDAQRRRFFGSPTVQVNGVDIEPSVRGHENYAFGCRIYGRSGVPPRELIERALREGQV